MAATPRVLIVDDEQSQRLLLGGFLRKCGFEVGEADSVESAKKIFAERGFDLAILDLRLPDGDGIELLGSLRMIDPDLSAVILTAYGSVESAVGSVKAGAAEFLQKPVDLQTLEQIIRGLWERKMIAMENRTLKETISLEWPEEVISRSRVMQEILSMVSRIAPTDAPVLITGESGTGKELIARLIHKASQREKKPFVPINCAAIPETLLESELFGYEPGAFTGATKRKPGKFEMANGGTIFLDEIGDFPPLLQAKILRFLEDGIIFRLGGNEPVKTDVRIISATNRPIEKMVKEKIFREDLFFRLNVIRISIPPLRERADDLLAMADVFLKDFAKKHGKEVDGFSPSARDRLLRYQWPGNVRELRNAVERAVILARTSLIPPELLPEPMDDSQCPKTAAFGPPFKTLEELEKEYIKQVLAYCNGNQSEASKILGIHRNTLRNKLKEYGMDTED